MSWKMVPSHGYFTAVSLCHSPILSAKVLKDFLLSETRSYLKHGFVHSIISQNRIYGTFLRIRRTSFQTCLTKWNKKLVERQVPHSVFSQSWVYGPFFIVLCKVFEKLLSLKQDVNGKTVLFQRVEHIVLSLYI